LDSLFEKYKQNCDISGRGLPNEGPFPMQGLFQRRAFAQNIENLFVLIIQFVY
jgi:hypothetical protein